jgi:hypothetical protein
MTHLLRVPLNDHGRSICQSMQTTSRDRWSKDRALQINLKSPFLIGL